MRMHLCMYVCMYVRVSVRVVTRVRVLYKFNTIVVCTVYVRLCIVFRLIVDTAINVPGCLGEREVRSLPFSLFLSLSLSLSLSLFLFRLKCVPSTRLMIE